MDFTDGVLENEVGITRYIQVPVYPNCILNKLAELEDRSSRNNLCVDGIKEEKKEALEMCETKVKEISQEKLEIKEGIITERANRPKWKTTRNNTAGNISSQEQL